MRDRVRAISQHVRRTSVWQTLSLLVLAAAPLLHASGPRYVTGWPYFYSNGGNPVLWSTPSPLYYTDPGDLSASVSHQAADAIVAAAASAWNVPVANITLAQGGALDEHVSSANVFLGTSGLVFPADVASTNYAAKPIAVIYDSDGSVTDELLGGGASDPSGCRQNAVSESVDRISVSGTIQHAILILNGRCTGPAPEQQLQIQYQLMRAFGRILGLAWSQTNDNVFTGSPQPTYQQALHWPILHPIDILCGPYTYQCLPQPFQLRADDIASLVAVYPITKAMMQSSTPPAAGKQVSLAQANISSGQVLFPTGQGMSGVNVLIQRVNPNETSPEAWITTSVVTGIRFRRVGTTPLAAADTSVFGSMGATTSNLQGYFTAAYIPIQSGYSADNLVVSTEPVNPLYTGSYSLGPYPLGTVTPSGSSQSLNLFQASAGGGYTSNLTVADAASTCGSGTDGTQSAPVATNPTGWSNGLLCPYGHFAWTTLAVHPNRTLTLEVTALDEHGLSSTTKALPVLGVWGSADSTTSLPTIGSATAAFNSRFSGMTALTVSTGTQTGLKMVIADQRAEGRPDFAYQSRVFYADTVTPATLPAAGGTLTITGMGFRGGNAVTVNGVLATGITWGANSLVVTVPSMSAANATEGVPVDLLVSDLSTGATSLMSGAFTYTSASGPNTMKLLSAQVGTAYANQPASVPFAVQVLKADGSTPVVGDTVTFTGSVAGSATSLQYGACGASTCAVTTDAQGVASTTVTPMTAGAVSLRAIDQAMSQSASFTALASAGSMQLTSAPLGSLYVGNSAATAFSVTLLAPDGKTPLSGRSVTLSTTTGSATFDSCVASPCVVTTSSTGIASSKVTPTAAGPVTLQATNGALTQTASFTALANAPVLKTTLAPSGSYPVGTRLSTAFQVLLTQADGVTPLANQPVAFRFVPASPDATATGLSLGPCNQAACTVTTNTQGLAGIYVDLTHVGTYTLQASNGQQLQTTTVTGYIPTAILKIISAPSGTQLIGVPSATPFTAQVLASDGVTPLANQEVILSGLKGTVALSTCPFSNCLIATDSTGYATETVTPLILGPIVLQAVVQQLQTTTQFTGISSSDTMTVVSTPSSPAYLNQLTPLPFAVQIIAAGQITPTPNKSVTFSVTKGTARFSACPTSATTCTVVTDATGTASTFLTPGVNGTLAVTAADGAITQSLSLTITPPPDVMRLTSAPSGSLLVGNIAATPFAVQVLQPGGVLPAVGKPVTLSVTNGNATLGACGLSHCVVNSDIGGNVSTTVKPLSISLIGLLATDGTATQTATFTGQVNPDTLHLVSAPAGSVYVGTSAPQPLTLQVLAGDGVTPVAGRSIPLSLLTGSASFSACPSIPCVLVTDANGLATTSVSPLAPGLVTLQATDGTLLQTATFTALATTHSLTGQPSTLLIAPDATVSWPLTVSVLLNGAPGIVIPVAWTASSGIALAPSSLTDTSGTSSLAATVGPLSTGTATITACAWTTACAQFQATVSPTSTWRLKLVSGAGQSATGSTALQPVVVSVLDTAGHPIAGAPVTIMQTVTTRTFVCAARGRCPVAPILASSRSQAIADLNGLVTIQPATLDDLPTSTNIAASAGAQGFVTAILTRSP
jgi:hypothetical protein